MAQALIDLLKSQFPTAVLETHSQHGDETVVLDVRQWKAVAEFLYSSPKAAMNMLTDLTVVDYPDREPRFEVVAHLLSLSLGHRLRIKARVGDEAGEGANIDTLTEIWASANWAEREAFDMFGVNFVGHPDLRRILMYPEFQGHALRKDYPADKIQPLVPYREIPGIEKVAPFGRDEGMSFGRQTHSRWADDSEDSQAN
ncbi:MAG: NADH-quinone oxidoreductase subunit C [Polyangiaceae bacterium]|nr:NADH-quinone oxidoreductase subunit C [Polyangiaceae bacterium]